MVISKEAYQVIQFSSDFVTWAKEQGINNPFALERKSLQIDENGHISIDPVLIENKSSRAKKDAWIMKRDEYIARRCFYEIGYETFLAHTQPKEQYDISFMRALPEFVPCRSLDGQCRLDCIKFGGKCDEENL